MVIVFGTIIDMHHNDWIISFTVIVKGIQNNTKPIPFISGAINWNDVCLNKIEGLKIYMAKNFTCVGAPSVVYQIAIPSAPIFPLPDILITTSISNHSFENIFFVQT